VEVLRQAFLTSALDGGELLVSRPGRFTTGERYPVRIGQEADWAPEVSGRCGEGKISVI